MEHVIICIIDFQVNYAWNNNFDKLLIENITSTLEFGISCSFKPNKYHKIYTREPRDINILEWYEDGKRMGWTMM
jgi:hypothetical protein